MDLIKKPYEISLWEDILTFVYEDGEISEEKMEGGHGAVVAQYYKERKICIIGSDTMDTPIRAVQGKLNSKINGENILTFNMYSHYYDEELEEFLPNPFIGLLVNERKVKLRYGELGAESTKWYDFVIKDIQKNSESKTYTYTAKDLFINELSKSGFNLVFNAELENNMGNIETLAGRVLEESDWQLEGADVLKQTVNEPLYIIKTNRPINAYNLEKNEEKLQLASGAIIYAFYNNIINKEDGLQFLYAGPQESDYEVDDDNIIINSSNWYIEKISYNGDKPTLAESMTISDKFRGRRLVRQPRIEYDATIDKYVNVYNDGQIYGFTETEYTSPATIRSFVSNASEYTSTNAWKSETNNLKMVSVPDVRDVVDIESTTFLSCLEFSAEANQSLYNSGIIDNRQYIDNFAKGEYYVFKIKCGNAGNSGEYGPKDLNYEVNELVLSICEYDIDSNGRYIFDDFPVYFKTDVLTKVENNYFQAIVDCKNSLSYSQMLSKGKTLGLFITSKIKQDIYIEDLQFFKYIDKGEGVPLLPDEIAESKILTTYYYYRPNPTYTSIKDLVLEAKSHEPISSTYIQDYRENEFEKVRSITASESNRFNLIQELCEIFECWPKFRIEHNNDTGEILMDENYRPIKWVSFHEYVGNSDYNWSGFKYGINLKQIQRTLQSDSIVSKIIVKDNSNEFATDGACSIARASENPSGENFILDFGYYIQQGMIGLAELTNDLYLDVSGYIGYYKNLKRINTLRDQYIIEQSGLLGDIAEYSSSKQTYENNLASSKEQLQNTLIEIKDTSGYSFDELITPKVEGDNLSQEDKKKNDWKDNDGIIAKLNLVGRLKASISRYEILAENASNNLKLVQDRYDELNRILTSKKREEGQENEERLLVDKIKLHSAFYKKYSRFLQEGPWISEDYVDDNLYFLDAQSTLYTSSKPRIDYNILVLELSQLEGYENFSFALGDKTFMEDIEFFGWAQNGSPYKEEIIVSELITVFDSPDQNQIKVQNYKTQFDDLFQRMAATTQTVEYSTGKYQKVSNIIEQDGTINISTLQNSIANNALILSNAKDQSVVWDETGITTTSLTKPNEMVRLISGGLFLSNDGGITWNTGITGNGINANSITTGQIDTSVIHILNGGFPSFRWDGLGLSAFEFSINETTGNPQNFNSAKFVRFDQYGLYGINGYSNFDPTTKKEEEQVSGEDKIWENANFALTWRGFLLKNDNGSVRITSSDDIQVLSEEQERIKIGRLGQINNTESYGIRIKDVDNNIVMETDDKGFLWLKNRLNIGTFDTNIVGIGQLGKKNEDVVGRVIDANNKFIVYEDGSMKATEGEFTGTIHATGGTIGGLSVDDFIQKGYEVIIESDSGNIFKNGKGTKTLTARLYKGREEVKDNEKINYQWYKDNTVLGLNTKSISIDAKDLGDDGAVYSCTITLISNEQEG